MHRYPEYFLFVSPLSNSTGISKCCHQSSPENDFDIFGLICFIVWDWSVHEYVNIILKSLLKKIVPYDKMWTENN